MSATSPKTEKQLVDHIAAMPAGASAAEMVASILDEFRVVKLPAPVRASQPHPKVGQQWRNRASGRVVQIVSASSSGWGGHVDWVCVDGSRGPSRGSGRKIYWDDRFDYVGEGN